MKKYLKLIILPALVLIASIIILVTNIPHLEYKYDNYYEGYIITKAVGNAEYYKIEDNYKDKPIVGIGENAFLDHKNLKEIILPDSVKVIQRRAFYNCVNLESINLDKVEEIERGSFSYCNSLTSINVGAKKIGSSVFYKCKNLEEIKLSNTKVISDMAFASTIISKISIPSSCETFGNDVFYECVALTEINVYGSYLKGNSYLKSLNIVNYIEKE